MITLSDVITLAEVKTLLQITNTSKDSLIEMLIPIVKDDLLTYLNNNFTVDSVTTYPSALKLYMANMINYKLNKPKDNVKSESIDDYSVAYNTDSTSTIAGYPVSIMKGLEKWKKVRWS